MTELNQAEPKKKKSKKTYSITRKINLGKYGLQFEAIDVSVAGAESFSEAELEVGEEKKRIHQLFTVEQQERLTMLEALTSLNPVQQQEIINLRKIVKDNSPF